MKTEKFILFILKVLCVILLVGGGFMILGSAGALERDHITMLQCLIQEIIAILCVASSFILFVIRENLKSKCHKRIKSKNLKAKRSY